MLHRGVADTPAMTLVHLGGDPTPACDAFDVGKPGDALISIDRRQYLVRPAAAIEKTAERARVSLDQEAIPAALALEKQGIARFEPIERAKFDKDAAPPAAKDILLEPAVLAVLRVIHGGPAPVASRRRRGRRPRARSS